MSTLRRPMTLFPKPPKKADPERISAAYTALRQAPEDPDLHVELASALIPTRRHDLVRRHLRRALALAPAEWDGGVRAGNLFFRLGDVVEATDAFRAGGAHTARDGRALWALSAIQYDYGDRSIAQELLRHGARLRRIKPPKAYDPDKPTILRLRCVDGNKLRMRHDPQTGQYLRQLTGGHFSTRDLFDPGDYNLFVANLTEGAMPPTDTLPQVDVILNAIGCADKNAAGLHQAVEVIESLPPCPVINDPKRVLHTTRAENARRLGALAGVTFPRTECVACDAPPGEVARRIEALELGYPVILRRPGTQTGESVALAETRDDVVAYLSELAAGQAVYAIGYYDCRGTEGFYHKTRTFFIDGQMYPVAALTSDMWNIHSANRNRVMADHAWMRDRERAYLEDPRGWLGADILDRLYAVNEVIGLEFLGIDFTLRHDGSLVIFEANAAMRHNFDYATAFPYTRPHLEHVSSGFAAMLRRRALMVRQSGPPKPFNTAFGKPQHEA